MNKPMYLLLIVPLFCIEGSILVCVCVIKRFLRIYKLYGKLTLPLGSGLYFYFSSAIHRSLLLFIITILILYFFRERKFYEFGFFVWLSWYPSNNVNLAFLLLSFSLYLIYSPIRSCPHRLKIGKI